MAEQTNNDGVIYHDQIADKWTDLYAHKGFQKRKAMFDRILKQYVDSDQRWLDAGCGSGVLSQLIAERGAEVLGIDASVPMLESAQHRVSTHSDRTRIEYKHVNTVEDLGDLGGVFDGIVCSSVVEYVNSPISVLEEFWRNLKPDGILIVSVPNRYSIVRAAQKMLRLMGRVVNSRIAAYLDVSINEYSNVEFKELLEQQGYECLEKFAFDPVLPRQMPIVSRSLLIFVARKTNA